MASVVDFKKYRKFTLSTYLLPDSSIINSIQAYFVTTICYSDIRTNFPILISYLSNESMNSLIFSIY